MQNSQAIKVINILLVISLMACNSNQRYDCRNKGYLKTPPLRALNSPYGITLPLQSNEYKIPSTSCNSFLSKELDIRPPVQSQLLH